MNWRSPLNIPAGKSGEYELKKVTHPAMTELNVVSLRTALFSGVQPEKVRFSEPVTFHYLKDGNGTLMSDIPEEQYDHAHVIDRCSGTVLIAGLGLGYIATMLAKKKTIDKIVVVEISKDVIKLVWNFIATPKIALVNQNIWKYLYSTEQRFDYVYLDTWSGTGETEFLETVLPMRIASYQVLKKDIKQPKNRVLAWKESVMRGQISAHFIMTLRFPETLKQIMDMPEDDFKRLYEDKWGAVQYPFWDWVRKTKPETNYAIRVALKYAEDYGEHVWKKRWIIKEVRA